MVSTPMQWELLGNNVTPVAPQWFNRVISPSHSVGKTKFALHALLMSNVVRLLASFAILVASSIAALLNGAMKLKASGSMAQFASWSKFSGANLNFTMSCSQSEVGF